MKFILAIFSIVFSLSIFAQTTTIKGKVDDPNLKEIRIAIFDDYFSLKNNLLAKSKLISQGFKMDFNIQKPFVARLYGGLYDKQLIIEPGASYEVTLKNDSTQRLIITQSGGTPGINQMYVDLLFEFDEFVTKNEKPIIRGQFTKEILAYTQNLKDSLSTQMQNPLIADLIHYRCAELEMAGRAKSRSKAYVDYLYKMPVNVFGSEYMYFFKEFYSNYFYENYIKNSSTLIREGIKSNKGFNFLAKQFDTIPYYGNNIELRDLALLLGLTEALYDKDVFKNENIWPLIEEISTQNPSAQIKFAAKNYLAKYAPIKKGTAVTDVEIIDEKNQAKMLSSFFNKPVYLCFFDPFAETSAIEISSLTPLFDKYRDQIQFIPVAVKASAYELQEFKLGNAIKVPVYRMENVEDLIPFNIRSTIAFFTIDANGKFVNSSGPMPLFADSELESLAK